MTSKITASIILSTFLAICCEGNNFSVSSADSGLAGNWMGTSLCTIKDSPCHDENVIYHVTEPTTAGDLKIEADKIVDGKPEFMGTLDCKFDSKASTVTCKMSYGEWRFTVSGDRMNGTLTLSDGRLYRKISVQKDK